MAVPFQGEGPALPEVLGNQLPYMFVSAPTAKAPSEREQLKGLAVTSKVAVLDPAEHPDHAGSRSARL